MEINGNLPPQVINPGNGPEASESRKADADADDRGRTAEGAAGGGRSAEGRVDVSLRARQMAAARKAVDQAPDVRTERVEALTRQIDSGTYNVSGKLVAQALVRHAALEAVA